MENPLEKTIVIAQKVCVKFVTYIDDETAGMTDKEKQEVLECAVVLLGQSLGALDADGE